MTKNRSMHPSDWIPTKIARGKYSNIVRDIIGFAAKVNAGNPLHPASITDTYEEALLETYARLQQQHSDLAIQRRHIKMPYWDPDDVYLPDHYTLVDAPDPLTTTSVTVVTMPNPPQAPPSMGYYFDGDTLPSLRERFKRERAQGQTFQGLGGNLGYYMTRDLIADRHPWSHKRRYPDFPLPPTPAYIGFYWFMDNDEIYSTFESAHPAAVGIRHDGTVEIISRLVIPKYTVSLMGYTFEVHSINAPEEIDDVMLFTPALRTPEIMAQADTWTYPFMVPDTGDDRIHLFVANQGNGHFPVDYVVEVWEGRCPLPSYGAILSFDPDFFKKHICADPAQCRGQRVRVRPNPDTARKEAGTNFEQYAQVMGGFVPVVVEGEHIYCVETVADVLDNLDHYANARSPIAECGRETRNFDLRTREPTGALIQTANRIGWVLFDGRHELSIGVSTVDVAKILHLLERDAALKETALGGHPIQNAFLTDGGSGMKVYAIQSDAQALTLNILNRVAPGSRNGPGADAEGLNLYTLLKLPFTK